MHTQQFRTFKLRMISLLAAIIICAAAQPVFSAKAKPKPKPKPVAKKVVTPAPAPAPAAPKFTKVVDVYAADPVSLKQTGSVVKVTVAPEDYEPAPIIVKSPKAITGAKVGVYADLTAGGSKLPKSNINAWVVDDGVLRKDSTARTTGDPVADLSANIQPFWLQVYAPKGTKAGTYKGYVTVSTDKIIGAIPIEVTVLSMRLLRSSKQYGMLIPFKVASVTPETYLAYLTELYNSGFSVSALPEPPETAADAFKAYKASKLGVHGIYAAFSNGAPVTAEDVQMVVSARKSTGASELFFLGADRPSGENDLSAARERLAMLRSAGVRTAARIDSADAYDYLQENLQAVIYNPEVPYVQSLMSGKTRSNGKREWYYWDASQDALKNRIYAGVMLWKSGLDGAYVEPGSVNYNQSCVSGGYSVLVPADAGVLPTVQWEMLREGIDDTRYLTTLMSVVREAKDQKVGKTITDEAEAYVSAFLQKPFTSLSYSDYEGFQAKLAAYIIKLRSIVKPS